MSASIEVTSILRFDQTDLEIAKKWAERMHLNYDDDSSLLLFDAYREKIIDGIIQSTSLE